MPRGRPPQDGTTRDRMIRVRCTSEQEALWRLVADAEGVDLSTWLRELADAAASTEAERVRSVLLEGIEKAKKARR